MSELESWLAQLATPTPLLSSTVQTADHKDVSSGRDDDLPPLDSFLAAIESQLPLASPTVPASDVTETAVTSIPLGAPVTFGQTIEDVPTAKSMSIEMRAALDALKEWSPSDDDILPIGKRAKRSKRQSETKKPKHRR